MAVYRNQQMKDRHERKLAEKQARKANKKARELQRRQKAKHPTPKKARPTTVQMQKNIRDAIYDLRVENDRLIHKNVELKALLAKASQPLAAAA